MPLLNGLLNDRDLGADAIRGLAALDDPGTPALLLRRFRSLRPDARAEAIVALSSRPTSARALLAAVADAAVDRADVPAFQIRQMHGFPDDEIRRRVTELWPELRTIPAAKRERIAQLRTRLDTPTLATADLQNGRKLFVQICANCHTLFGTGGKIGPDLTGAQRSDLGYVLENVIDPAATVAADYRMSTARPGRWPAAQRHRRRPRGDRPDRDPPDRHRAPGRQSRRRRGGPRVGVLAHARGAARRPRAPTKSAT